MFLTPEDAMFLIRECGITVAQPESFAADTQTRQASPSNIRDDAFFRLLGVPKIKAIDVSDYEGADIVHDLTTPLPKELEESADFILDGSTLDNVFDPALTLRNIGRHLKPGGRLVSVNLASNHYGPYTILTPFWLLDYFAVNAFADCKIYVIVYGDQGINIFTPDLSKLDKASVQPNNFTSPYVMALVVLAEKGEASTWDKTPIQHQYRSDWDHFSKCHTTIKNRKRPELARSLADCFIESDDYLYIDKNGNKRPALIPVDAPTAPSIVVTAATALRDYPLLYRIARKIYRVVTGKSVT
jgi:SAM-dependent methyltransferase